MSILSTLFVVVCSIPLIFGQRYVPPPGYERRYGAKDVNEWPSKKVYGEKTPRPTQYYGKGNWMKPTPKPTEYIETPYAKDVNEWPSKKVYDEKTPRPTQYYGKGNWMKPTPNPTEYIKTPYAKNVYTKAPKTP